MARRVHVGRRVMNGDDQRTAFTPSSATDDLPEIIEGDLDFCGDCGDSFRYDDCGGYNPPCECGFACRSCCEHGNPQFCAKQRERDFDDDDRDDFDPVDPDE